MKPIEFPEQNTEYAKSQAQYKNLPSYRGPAPEVPVISCWALNEEERKRIAETGVIWLSVWTFGSPLQPLLLTANKEEAGLPVAEPPAESPSPEVDATPPMPLNDEAAIEKWMSDVPRGECIDGCMNDDGTCNMEMSGFDGGQCPRDSDKCSLWVPSGMNEADALERSHPPKRGVASMNRSPSGRWCRD